MFDAIVIEKVVRRNETGIGGENLGFRKGKGNVDHIFTIKKLTEDLKKRERVISCTNGHYLT